MLSDLLYRLRALFKHNTVDRELNEELAAHFEREVEKLMLQGLPPEEATRQARLAFGGFEHIKDECRQTWGVRLLETTLQDVHYGLRAMRKSPGFTTVAVLTLALGIGANTAIFSLLNALVLRLLPVNNPQQLVQFTYTFSANGEKWNSWFGYPQLTGFREQAKTMSGIFGGTTLGRVNVAYQGSSGLAQGDAYTDNFFSVLGVTPQHGRFFLPGEDRADASAVVLSDHYWRSRFAADPSIIGQTVDINQTPFTIIGVTPSEFSGITVGVAPDLWVPLHALDRFKPAGRRWTAPFTSWLLIAGRLNPGVSLTQAEAELAVIHRQLLQEQLAGSEKRESKTTQAYVRESRLILRPAESGMNSGLRESYALPLKLLLGVAGLVLLIACANVANLLLARASNRRREIAIRLALGAARRRVLRQLLTESLLLAALGGSLAVAVAWLGSAALVRMISTSDFQVPLDVRPDWMVFGFAAVVSLITGVFFGLAPAMRGARVDPGPAIKTGTGEAARTSSVSERLLVIAQVALSVVLITGAGLLVRTLQKLWSVDAGYDRENVLMFSLDAKLARYPGERARSLYQDILRKLQALPEIASASASVVRPDDDYFSLVDEVQEIDGRKLPDSDAIRVAWNSVSPGYFSTVATPILLGRDFTFQDQQNTEKVVIVNESLAHAALPGQNPIGHRLDEATIVGVVKDSHYRGVRDPLKPVLYHPLFQHGLDQEYQWGFVSFELKYHGGAGLAEEVRSAIASADSNLPIFRMRTLSEQAQQSLLRERLLAMLSSFFGVLALLLACLGLYGLMAYSVARRTSEIGVRMALGARRENILSMVLREAALVGGLGLAAGFPMAWFATRLLKSQLFGLTPHDPSSFIIAMAAIAVVTGVASYLPARRASRIEPMVALRYE